MEAARGQKHPSDAENGMKESIYWKKFLVKVAQQPQKPLDGSNQIWVMTSVKKNRSQQPARSLYSSINATLYVAAAGKTSRILEQDQRSWLLVCTLIKGGFE